MDARTALVALLVTGALAWADLAHAQPRDVAIEDRSGRALETFHRALRSGGRARAMFWGASHTASDQYTGELRAEWQRRYGDAGPGFVIPVRAFSLHAHRQVIVGERGAWSIVRGRSPGAFGPAGIALDATRPANAWAELARGVDPVDLAAIHFMRQPNGGTIEARVLPGGARQRVSTRGTGADTIVLRGAIRRVELHAVGDGPVRVFGVSLERDRPGVIVDALGIPGARMRDRLPWDDVALRAQLTRLDPDLVVLAYGTNESGGRGGDREAREIDEGVRRVRSAAPEASCLLIGPSDWPLRGPDGWAPRPRTLEVASRLRAAAAQHGCAYFDFVGFMGGPASMPRWVDAGLALGDYVHFTDEGYALLARALSRALLPR
jgi:lysophospholipase L1-like esterase